MSKSKAVRSVRIRSNQWALVVGLTLAIGGIQAGLVSTETSANNWALASHPFHVSVAEIEWNRKTGKLECALRVWPEDLEKALTRREKEKVDLEKIENLEKKTFDYLKRKVRVLTDKGKAVELSWIGMEVELKQAWLYFEVEARKEPLGYTFTNELFFELQADQVNLFHFRTGERRASLTFVKDRSIQELTEKQFVPIRNPFARKK